MKQLKYITICIGLLVMSACSPEKIAPDGETGQSAEVCLVANISGSGNGSRADNNTPSYIKTTFNANDKIYLANTKHFTNPNKFYEFSYANLYNTQKGYKFTQTTGTETDDPITWDDFTPTSAFYMFEAIYYPGNTAFEEVSDDQNNNSGDGFKKADLLITHHRMDIKDKNEDIELTFHHAFAMVQVEVVVATGAAGLPQDAIQSAFLKNIHTGYTIDYTATTQNDGSRTVTGSGDLKDVKMWLQSKPVNSTDKTQTYIFLGIIPVPEEQITGTDFVHFKVKVNNVEKTYRFVPSGDTKSITLRQAHVTILKLTLGINGELPLLLDAEIKPWTEASAGMILDEEDSLTDNGQTGEGNQTGDQEGGA